MRKFIIGFVIAVCAVGGLAGCGKATDGTPTVSVGGVTLTPTQIVADLDLAFSTLRPVADAQLVNINIPAATKVKIGVAENAAAAAIARLKVGSNTDLSSLRNGAQLAMAAINDVLNAVDNPPGTVPVYVRGGVVAAEVTVNLLLQLTAPKVAATN